MKLISLLFCIFCIQLKAEIKHMPDIKIIRDLTKSVWEEGITDDFIKCRETVDNAILDAAKKGEFTTLIELEYAPGFVADAIVRYLKNSGYNAIVLLVGGLQGTSFHTFIQISWFINNE
jgi:hypothetical protein